MIKKASITVSLAIFILIVSGLTNGVNSSMPSAGYDFVAPWVWDEAPLISMQSPVNGTCVSRVLLNFTVEKPGRWYNNQSEYWISSAIEQMLTAVAYEIDGNSTTINVESNLFSSLNYLIPFANIADGFHSVRVYANSTGAYRNTHGVWQSFPINSSYETVVVFTVDSKPPNISNLRWTAEGKPSTNVKMAFQVNEPTSWITYCIDNQSNVTITGNATISNFPKGVHELRVYAADYAGNIGSSKMIYIDTEPFPATIILAVSAALALAIGGTIFYFKKRHH